MKKILLFLSIILFSMSGLLFACGNERYSDLKISVEQIVTADSGKPLTYDAEGNFYTIKYGESFSIKSSVTCSDDINKSLTYKLVNSSFNILDAKEDSFTSADGKCSFTAIKPSSEQLFAIDIESVETSKNSKRIYFKVVLPVSEIVVDSPLGLTYGTEIDMSKQVQYISVDPTCQYETTEKGVNVNLEKFIEAGNPDGFSLSFKDDAYYFTKDGQEVKAFTLNNGVIKVLRDDLFGTIVTTVKSVKFDEALDSLDRNKLTAEQQKLVTENDKLKKSSEIFIVKPITLNDLSFVGGQIAFSNSNATERNTKLTASLYLNNSVNTYQVDEINHHYNFEKLALTIKTKESIRVSATTTGNFVYIPEVGEPARVSEETKEYNVQIQTNPNSATTGTDNVDLKFAFSNFKNTLEFSFSSLYQKYLNTLTIDEYANLKDYEKTNKLVFETSALADEIGLMQDGESKENKSTIKIFDKYEGKDYSRYGTKIFVNLKLPQGLLGSEIKKENRKVRVYITGNDVLDTFTFRNANYTEISLLTENSGSGATKYYFDFNSYVMGNYFYVEAKKTGGEPFKFEFENLLENKITTYKGVEILSQSAFSNDPNNNNLKNKLFSLTVNTVKGVDEILVLTKVNSNYYGLDNNNVDTSASSFYNKLVLQKSEGNASITHGTLIGFFANAGISVNDIEEDLDIIYDQTYLTLFNVDGDPLNLSNGINDSKFQLKTTLSLKGVISVVGLKVGLTTITFKAKNGYSVSVNVEVVNTFNENNLKIEIEPSIGNSRIVTKQEFDATHTLTRAYAKVNGTFVANAYTTVNGIPVSVFNLLENAGSGVFGVTFNSTNPVIAYFLDKKGKVVTNSEGEQTILTMTIDYYAFEPTIGNSYYQCVKKSSEKSFSLRTFIPAKTISLNTTTYSVFDVKSLGYGKESEAQVNLTAIITDNEATINHADPIANLLSIDYELVNDKSNLIGGNGKYLAYLNADEKNKEVIVRVTFTEFGEITTRQCVVRIEKAVQIEDILVSAFKNVGSEQKAKTLSKTESEALYMSAKSGEKFEFRTNINPSANKVHLNELFVKVYGSEQEKNWNMILGDAQNKSHEYGALSKTLTSELSRNLTITDNNFVLHIGENVSGYFYVVIYARDSMTSTDSGKVYKKIRIQVTNGTKENPFAVENASDLNDIRLAPSMHYVLANNLTIDAWTPIPNFCGTLNGYNINILGGTTFKISGLQFTNLMSENIGLFEKIIPNALTNEYGAVMNLALVVKNINLTDNAPSTFNTINVGTIAGVNEGIIYNCAVTVENLKVNIGNKKVNVGGVVGVNKGAIYNFAKVGSNQTSKFNLSTSGGAIADKGISENDDALNNVISKNPINVKMNVSDSSAYAVNVGGMVGSNENGLINGQFGAYNLKALKERTKINYLTSFQSQGVDVTTYINIENASIVNANSKLGGVVGSQDGGNILNVSVEGQIGKFDFANKTLSGVLNNVGGVVGSAHGIQGEQAVVQNVVSNVKVRGQENVGGIAGYMGSALIKLARVEAIETGSDNTMIIGFNKVGGVVGSVSDGITLEYTYSYSFVNKYLSTYMQYGDLYLASENSSFAGGLIGYADVRSIAKLNISSSYSTFNLMNNGTNQKIAGLAGLISDGSNLYSNETVSINDVFYIGVLNNTTNGQWAYNLPDGKSSSITVGKYNYYYLLKYANNESFTDSGEINCLIVDSFKDANEDLINGSTQTTFKPSSVKASTPETFNQVLKYDFYKNAGSGYTLQTSKLRVPCYKTDEGDLIANFVKIVPTSMEIKTKGESVREVDGKYILDFNNKDGNKNLYFSLNTNGKYSLILNYSTKNNLFNLNDLFEAYDIRPEKTQYGILNILVSSSNTDLLEITNDGHLIVKGVGKCKLTFKIRENLSVSRDIVVEIIKNFDELLVSDINTLSPSLFEKTDANKYNTRIEAKVNVFNVFAEYVDKNQRAIDYSNFGDELALIEIINSNGYKLNYRVEYRGVDDVDYRYLESANDVYLVDGNGITFYMTGFYKVTLSIDFMLNSSPYSIVNENVLSDNWSFYFNAFAGATSISFNNTNAIWLEGEEIYRGLQVILNTDVKHDDGSYEDLKMFIVDANTKEEFEYFYKEPDFKTTDEYKKIPFEIVVAEKSAQNKNYYYDVTINIKKEFRYVQNAKHYYLKVYDKEGALIDTPAIVDLYLAPTRFKQASTTHYPYTQTVSQLINIGNTNSEDAGKITYSYSFSTQPKSTIIAGSEGLFVIDLDPYYANITSVNISSSLGQKSGNALQFVQLVKIKGGNNAGYDGRDYFIYAPLNQVGDDNGIKLNLMSYIPSDVALLKFNDDSSSSLEMKKSELSYKFDSEGQFENSARLYVKTVAPSNLKAEDNFTITVTVRFRTVNSNGNVVEEVKTYMHNIEVEAMPGFSISVQHENKERKGNIIAYTGENTSDWLDIVANVEKDYNGKSYTYEPIKGQISFEGNVLATGVTTNYFRIDNNRLTLEKSVDKAGYEIKLFTTVKISSGGFTESRTYSITVKVVDVVIEDITVKDLNIDNEFSLTVSNSKQLRAVIKGFGTEENLQKAEDAISRSVSEDNSIYYWYAKTERADTYFVNLDSAEVVNSLPFTVEKIGISNDNTIIDVNENSLGITTGERYRYVVSPKIIVLEGSTKSGTVEMSLSVSYVYDKDLKISFVPNSCPTNYKLTKSFKVVVTKDSNEDNPTPIYTEEDLIKYSKTTGGHYILMQDLEITAHASLPANFSSFDGNNKVITINSFSYSTNLTGTNSNYSINMGLFDTVNSGTIIKNLIVALPSNKSEPMNLKNYTTINFGGICAVNKGIITNCDVITTTNAIDTSLNNYVDFYYTLNIETSSKSNVNANIGAFAGVNEESGIITNSRVGRDKVEILKVNNTEATVVYKELYKKTAPVTAIKVAYGRASVGGFVSTNRGTISSSFVQNLQLEVFTSADTESIKTGGFVATNTGYIYGSFSAGWEEEEGYSNSNEVKSAYSDNRKLGGGIFTNGYAGGFVYSNEKYIEDCYSNINLSGSIIYAGRTPFILGRINQHGTEPYAPTGVGGFVYFVNDDSYIFTSYSLSKISDTDQNTYGPFETPWEDKSMFVRKGVIEDCYFMQERTEKFRYYNERARKLSDDPVIDVEGIDDLTGTNEFINKSSFNNFSFDNGIVDFKNYNGQSKGGVWAIYKRPSGTSGYPELISANTVALSCRIINATKTNASTNTFYYTYADGYDLGSYKNPYIISSFEQFNNIFKDALGGNENHNETISTKFTGNIRLINNINFTSTTVYSSSVEYTSLLNLTSIFDGNYLAMYNISLSARPGSNISSSQSAISGFGLFKDLYYVGVKNLTLGVKNVTAGNAVSVGALAGVIVNSNISNVTLVASSSEEYTILGNNYVGALAGIIVSQDKDELYTTSKIKSNLSVASSKHTDGSQVEVFNSLTYSGLIWNRITNSNEGLQEYNNNLDLHKIPNNVYYAGGIAGVVDLHQLYETKDDKEVTQINLYNIHVGEFVQNTIIGSTFSNFDSNVRISATISGGLFGFIGAQTYLESSEFIAKEGSGSHYISGDEIAGGITGVNFGKISQSYVSFNEETTQRFDLLIRDFVENQKTNNEIALKTDLFSNSKTTKYIGGIAGINAGNGYKGTGVIADCYNRLDVRNESAIGVGGIVGGSYIGQISNVYTTASLLGDTANSKTKIGAIIGRVFDEGEGGEYFADFIKNAPQNNKLIIYNVVALNLWNQDDFEILYNYVVKNGGDIGALYGKYINKGGIRGDGKLGIIKLDGYIYVQNYAIKDYTDEDLINFDNSKPFNVGILSDGTYFELWGLNKGGRFNDTYLYGELCQGQTDETLIFPNDYMALFSGTREGGSPSSLRNTYFNEIRWSKTIWNYDWNDNIKILLPILKSGYETSIVRIYTANQFIEKLTEGDSEGKLFILMNDIDFDSIPLKPINTVFRGQLFGNNVTYKVGNIKYTRKPILFNIDLQTTDDKVGMFSIIQNSVGATYSNFNIVLRNYSIDFNKDVTGETISSAFLGNATNTSINNVHIYSSLLDYANRETLTDMTFDEKTEKESFKVSQGFKADDVKKVTGISVPYVITSTLISDDETTTEESSFTLRYLYLYNEKSNRFLYSGFFNTKDYVLVSDVRYLSESQQILDNVKNGLTVFKLPYAQTNATTAGIMLGVGSLAYITNSSVNLNIKFLYTQPTKGLASKYLGAIVGRHTGEIRYTVSTSNIDLVHTYMYDYIGGYYNELYLGGVVGQLKGSARYCYYNNATMNVGSPEYYTRANNGATGTFAGGVIGEVDRYLTVSGAVVGGSNYIFVIDSTINAYVNGTAHIGGLIGSNKYTAGNLFVKQSKDSTHALNLFVDDEFAEINFAGIIANSNLAYLSETYTNSTMNIQIGKNTSLERGVKALNVGGIVARTDSDCLFEKAVNDAKEIILVGKKRVGTLNIGGIVAFVGENMSTTLLRCFVTCNIISDQVQGMVLGGAVGLSDKVTAINSVMLGNIKLNRGVGFVEDSFFYSGAQYVGGFIGKTKRFATDNINNEGVIILSTIRDYSPAQKTDLEEGPVIGNTNLAMADENKDYNKVVSQTLKNVYYCEPLALVSDNGYSSYIESVEQANLTINEDKFTTVFDIIFDNKGFNIDENYYSNFYENYFELSKNKIPGVTKRGEYILGSKLRPIEFAGILDKDKYYILTSNITSQIEEAVSSSTGWILNAQGFFSEITDTSVFVTIPEDCGVVGLLSNVNKRLTNNAPIATNNYGFVVSCGSGGKIEGESISGLVYNNYGIVNSSFSIADIIVKGAVNTVGGLVYNNGDDTHIGNIYCSYYTGTIRVDEMGEYNLCGLVYDCTQGVISNSYTMSDFDITDFQATTYPIAITDGKNNLYNTFYDYVAYIGTEENEGEVFKMGVDGISSKGHYVWSPTLAGDTTGGNFSDITTVIKGNWLTPGDESVFHEMYKKSLVYLNGDKTIKLDNSWFNYGYMTNNFSHISIDQNKYAYLQMIYTGNGIKSRDNEAEDIAIEDQTRTNGFIDGPYKVKHAGILDILVRANNNDEAGGYLYKYYIFVKNIDFRKYSKETYWSENWDDKKVIFLGELEGNDKIVINMYSSNGLLRALPTVGGINTAERKTRVANLYFKNCYSKTGLIATYLADGCVIERITFANKTDPDSSTDQTETANYVYNGSYDKILSGKITSALEEAKGISTITEIVIKVRGDIITFGLGGAKFAGGVVGYMRGGTIATDNTFYNINVLNSDIVDQTSYAGGLVGYMNGGVIGPNMLTRAASDPAPDDTPPEEETDGRWKLNGITIYSSCTSTSGYSKSYIGGVVGYLTRDDNNGGTIQNIYCENVLKGYYSIGGIAGFMDAGTIENCKYTPTTENGAICLTVSNTVVNENGIQLTPATNILELNVGGIVASIKGGNVLSNEKNGDINLNSLDLNSRSETNIGGIVGLLTIGTVRNNTNYGGVQASRASANLNTADIRVGGIIGTMTGGQLNENRAYGNISATGSSNSVAGGIIGLLTKGIIKGITSPTSGSDAYYVGSVDGVLSAGGIIGMIRVGNEATTDYVFIQRMKSEGRVGINNTSSANILTSAGGIVGTIVSTSGATEEMGALVRVSECLSKSNVGDFAVFGGGIVGSAYSMAGNSNSGIRIEECKFVEAGVTANNENNTFAGGIIGYLRNGTVVGCEVISASIGNYSANISGGVVGYVIGGQIGDIKTTSGGGTSARSIAGGIIGMIESRTSLNGTITNNFSVTASLSGGNIGVLAGSDSFVGTMTNTGYIGADYGIVSGGNVGLYLGVYNNTLRNLTNSGGVKALSGDSITTIYRHAIILFSTNTYMLNSDNTLINGIQATGAGGNIGYGTQELTLYNVRDNNTGSSVEGNTYAGGIIAYTTNRLTLSNASNVKHVTATGDNGSQTGYAGGIIGSVVSGYTSIASFGSNESIAYGSISNSGNITSNRYAGGIAGYVHNLGEFLGSITSSGTIYGRQNDTLFVGGLIGYLNNGDIGSSGTPTGQNSGIVQTDSLSDAYDWYAGGIVGYVGNSTINTISNSNHVLNAKYSGGLVGYMAGGNLARGQATSNINVKALVYAGGAVGGLAGGSISGSIRTSISGIISTSAGLDMNPGAGGLIGVMTRGNTAGSVNSANFDFSSQCVGGLIGRLEGGNVETGSVGCNVQGGQTHTGGAIGYMSGVNLSNPVNVGGRTVQGNTNVGGLIGYMASGTVGAGNSGNASDNSGGTQQIVGGIVGLMENGTVAGGGGGSTHINGGGIIGGLIGQMLNGTLSGGNGTIQSSTAKYAGGLVGNLKSGNVSGGATTGNISAIEAAGGIVGFMEGGNVSGGTGGSGRIDANNFIQSAAGGIVGLMINGSISGSPVSNVSLIASTVYAGGTVGHLKDGSVNGGSNNAVVTANAFAGGVVGYMESGSVGKSPGTSSEVRETTPDPENFGAGGIVGGMKGGSVSGGGNATNVLSNSASSGGAIGIYYQGTISGGSTAKVSVSGAYAGGLYGYMTTGNLNWSGTATPTIVGSEYAGGVVGKIKEGVLSGGIATEASVTGGKAAGGIAGYMQNASATVSGGKGGSVSCPLATGGLVGLMDNGTVSGGETREGFQVFAATLRCGGLVGEMKQGTITGGTAKGKIEAVESAGGLIGYMTEGTVTGGKSEFVMQGAQYGGGIVGFMMNGALKGGTANGTIKATTSTGGVAGEMQNGNIQNVTAGNVHLLDGVNVGGFVGKMYQGTIASGTASGRAEGKTNVGGAVGLMAGQGVISGGAVSKIVASLQSGYAGGVIGKIEASGIQIGGGSVNNRVSATGGYAGGIVGYSMTTENAVGVGHGGDTVSGSYAGGILGTGSISINNAIVGGTVNGSNASGGLVGQVEGNIFLSGNITVNASLGSNRGVITYKNPSGRTIGGSGEVPITTNIKQSDVGAVNQNFGTLVNITMRGSINSGSGEMGSLAKTNSGVINRCRNLISLSTTVTSLGGIAGKNNSGGTIYNCYNTVSISGGSGATGGIAGTNAGSIGNCENSGSVKGGSNGNIGGIAGSSSGTVANCTNTGTISGDGSETGSGPSLFGKTNTPTSKVGGIVGYASSGSVSGYNTGNTNIQNSVYYFAPEGVEKEVMKPTKVGGVMKDMPAIVTNFVANASITDYRGKIVGNRTASASVKNLSGHTEYKNDGEVWYDKVGAAGGVSVPSGTSGYTQQTDTRQIEQDAYYVVTFKRDKNGGTSAGVAEISGGTYSSFMDAYNNNKVGGEPCSGMRYYMGTPPASKAIPNPQPVKCHVTAIGDSMYRDWTFEGPFDEPCSMAGTEHYHPGDMPWKWEAWEDYRDAANMINSMGFNDSKIPESKAFLTSGLGQVVGSSAVKEAFGLTYDNNGLKAGGQLIRFYHDVSRLINSNNDYYEVMFFKKYDEIPVYAGNQSSSSSGSSNIGLQDCGMSTGSVADPKMGNAKGQALEMLYNACGTGEPKAADRMNSNCGHSSVSGVGDPGGHVEGRTASGGTLSTAGSEGTPTGSGAAGKGGAAIQPGASSGITSGGDGSSSGGSSSGGSTSGGGGGDFGEGGGGGGSVGDSSMPNLQNKFDLETSKLTTKYRNLLQTIRDYANEKGIGMYENMIISAFRIAGSTPTTKTKLGGSTIISYNSGGQACDDYGNGNVSTGYHYYSNSFSGDAHKDRAVQNYNLANTLTYVSNGYQIYSDCCGFIRLAAGGGGYSTSVAMYAGTRFDDSAKDKLLPGTVIATEANGHAVIYLYTDSSGKAWYIDQSCSVKEGKWGYNGIQETSGSYRWFYQYTKPQE